VFLITPIKMSGHTTALSLCKVHLKPLLKVALTITINCIHEEEGKYRIICINWYQMFATNTSNSSQSIIKVFFVPSGKRIYQ